MPKLDSTARVLRITVGVLIVTGVAAALSRYLMPHDLHLLVARPLYRDFTAQLPSRWAWA